MTAVAPQSQQMAPSRTARWSGTSMPTPHEQAAQTYSRLVIRDIDPVEDRSSTFSPFTNLNEGISVADCRSPVYPILMGGE